MKNETTETEIRNSVSSIYAQLLQERSQEREQRKAEKARSKEEKKAEQEQEETEELTKKEKREKQLAAWQSVITGLTGDDLEYIDEGKKKKKKYRKWISDDETGSTLTVKKKKVKKKNYNKEFEQELSMMKSIVSDANRFTTNLQKRFENAAGPATKDAMPLNKTLVELASTVNAARNNSLGYLNAITGIKKTIAELYMKQKKLENDLAKGLSSGSDEVDMGLRGSSIAASMFGDFAPPMAPGQMVESQPTMQATPERAQQPTAPVMSSNPYAPPTDVQFYDPSQWDGGGVQITPETMYERIPKQYVLEINKASGERSAKAIREDTGEELVGCPIPLGDLSKLELNEETMTAKTQFAQNVPFRYV